jgi:hypothetical protein
MTYTEAKAKARKRVIETGFDCVIKNINGDYQVFDLLRRSDRDPDTALVKCPGPVTTPTTKSRQCSWCLGVGCSLCGRTGVFKICKYCRSERPGSEYYRSKKEGLETRCKTCDAAARAIEESEDPLCRKCAGQSWRRPEKGCPTCGEPYAPERYQVPVPHVQSALGWADGEEDDDEP